MGHTFINALNDLLEVDIKMPDFEVSRERGTYNGGRIDILLEEKTKESQKKIIVIENKIYHSVENDLDDYLNTFNGHYVTGIILGLKKYNIHDDFISITHHELINAVKNRIGEEMEKAPAKYLIILQDFIYHMKQFDNRMEDQSYQFMFNEGINIGKLMELQDKMFYDIVDQIKKAAEICNWQHSRTSGWQQAITTSDGVYVLYFDLSYLFSKHEFDMILWIKGKGNIDKWNNQPYYKKTEDFAESTYIKLAGDPMEGKKEIKTAWKKYSINNYSQLKHFDDIVEKALNEDWNPLIGKFNFNFKF
jgi:hypothetical protein